MYKATIWIKANRAGVAGLRLPPLPHHPACGFDGAALALRAVLRTVCLPSVGGTGRFQQDSLGDQRARSFWFGPFPVVQADPDFSQSGHSLFFQVGIIQGEAHEAAERRRKPRDRPPAGCPEGVKKLGATESILTHAPISLAAAAGAV